MNRQEQLKEFEDELKKTKYNKRTEHAIGLLKAKIAKLREDIDREHKKSKRQGKGFSIKKMNDATVVLVGFPSVGKSTLLNRLTNAKSKVGSYDFTTVSTIPGVLNYDNTLIQIIDIPGLITQASSGSGRGREVLSSVRVADLIIVITTPNNINQLKTIARELWNVGIRLNKEKKDIRIKKKPFGGIHIGTTVKLDTDKRTLKDILREFKINNCDVLIRSRISVEDFIDAIQENVVYVPAIFVMNKIDELNKDKLNENINQLKNEGYNVIGVSAKENINIKVLKKNIFGKLSLMRIYLREVNKKTDFKRPIILKKGTNVLGLCNKIHRDFVKKFRFARIWGSSNFPGEKVGLNYKLKDKDVVQIHLR